jgi:hypothetical protein
MPAMELMLVINSLERYEEEVAGHSASSERRVNSHATSDNSKPA